jgi:uncharacterized protein YjbI with pentapeptide repeats
MSATLSMHRKGLAGAGEFEPPKYLSSLIGAVNDGAKAAQGGGLAFLLVGVYLLGTAFSASDEDLLLGKTVTISQIGASLPVSFSFAIAPLVFVFLHVYTLVRYDMLASNVRQFLYELRDSVRGEPNRERCRQLLANVEFVAALTTPRGSTLYSRFWPSLFVGIIALFPVAVLLLVQINALRYQSDMIVWVQRAWLALDLAVLTWFFARNPFYSDERKDVPNHWRLAVRQGLPVGLSALLFLLNLSWLGTAPPSADPELVRYNPLSSHWRDHSRPSFVDMLRQPLDLLTCRGLNWGCRFLRVDHRTLVGKVWDEKAVAELRKGTPDPGKLLPNLEGVFLRARSLRFALLDESRLYAADLIDADLRNASLTDADISGARLTGAILRGSNITSSQLSSASSDLSTADLSGLKLEGADLKARKLREAILEGTNLADAQLQGADLRHVNLEKANLVHCHLDGADLTGANLKFANLERAQLFGTDLKQTDLSHATLKIAFAQAANLTESLLEHTNLETTALQGAVLIRANLIGANLSFASLRAADLRGAYFEKISADGQIDLSLADLRNARGELSIPFLASAEEPVLVSNKSAGVLTGHPEWLIDKVDWKYIPSVSAFLVRLASDRRELANGVFNRAISAIYGPFPDDNAKPDSPAFQAPILAISGDVARHLLDVPGLPLTLDQRNALVLVAQAAPQAPDSLPSNAKAGTNKPTKH